MSLVLTSRWLPFHGFTGDLQPGHCANLCPVRCRIVLGLGDKHSFFKPVCCRALFLEGRKEPVIRLRRHPLIYPIFDPYPHSCSITLKKEQGKDLNLYSRRGTSTSYSR